MKKVTIPIGPYHPLLEEPEYFQLFCEGERVVDIDWKTGYNHRAIEKISESKSFEKVTFLIERICGICSTSHPIAYVNALEDLLQIDIPERARYIRSIIAELERIHSHLLWVGLAGHFLGYNTLFMWSWKYREPVLQIMERITGNRNNYAMMKAGGVRRDIEDEDIPYIEKEMDHLYKKLEFLTQVALDDPVLHARLKGVGVLTREEAKNYGAVGPVARASGLAIDVRRDSPYAAYDLVDWKVITQEEGDVFAKAVVRLLESLESVKIIRQCLKRLREVKGEIEVEVRDIPPGEGIGHAEAPRGEVYHYVLSDGTNRPVRHKVRAPSYNNIPTYRATVPGSYIADAAIILAGVDPCYCCTNRMVALDNRRGKTIYSAEDLIKLSQKKTERLRRKISFNCDIYSKRLK